MMSDPKHDLSSLKNKLQKHPVVHQSDNPLFAKNLHKLVLNCLTKIIYTMCQLLRLGSVCQTDLLEFIRLFYISSYLRSDIREVYFGTPQYIYQIRYCFAFRSEY